MDPPSRVFNASSRSILLQALDAYAAGEFLSIRACARHFGVPFSTLRGRMIGRTSRRAAHVKQQYLTRAEEQSLVNTITRLCRTGFPATPLLVREMAAEIRESRLRLATLTPSPLTNIDLPNPKWVQRLRTRFPELSSVYSRQIDAARHKALSYDSVKSWFSAVSDVLESDTFAPDRIYNMDETGFCLGTTQSSRVLVNTRELQKWKVQHGRQEWITAIECISASAAALPPLLIFKAKHANSGWIPDNTPPNWRFSTSTSGWTSDSHGYEWLTTIFEPETRPINIDMKRLLIMDGHSSHVTANVIQFCIEKNIELLILPPHTSHVLQPLDVGPFSPLKRALASESDALSRLDATRLSRVEWTAMFIRARQTAFTPRNIEAGWRKTALWPLSPISVLETLRYPAFDPSIVPRTPVNRMPLDLALLNSSPPTEGELFEATSLATSTIEQSIDVPSPAKRFTARALRALEIRNSENATLRKQVKEQKQLLETRKAHKVGKRVAIKGKFIFSRQEILDVVAKAEREALKRKSRKRLNIDPVVQSEQENMEEDIVEEQYESEGSEIIVIGRREE